MRLKRGVFPLQSIKRRDSGQVEWVTGLFLMLILMVALYSRLQMMSWHSTAVYMEDALAASNLASAVIDLEEYGRTHKIRIKNEREAFAVYQEALKANLGLDEQWTCRNKGLIEGTVIITNYTIYHVNGEKVESIRMGRTGDVLERREGRLGEVNAPDGTPVEHTGIYSEIQFMVKGVFGVTVKANKGKLADIVGMEGEVNENS